MRTFSFLSLLLFFSIFCSTVSGQDPVLRLESGDHPIPSDLEERLKSGKTLGQTFDGKVHALLSFDAIPDAEARSRMKEAGIRFLQYLPERSYIVGYDKGTDLKFLTRFEARSLQELKPEWRTSERLLERPYPSHAVNGDRIELTLNFFEDLSFQNVLTALEERLTRFQGEARVLRSLPNSQRVEVRVPQDELSTMAGLPYVQYLEAIDPEPTPDSRKGRTLHRSNVINSQVPGGKRFNGDSIVMAIADDGGIGPHIDFKGRVTDHTSNLGGGHGDMTAGIAIGAGNLDPTIQGHASGAHLHMYDINGYPHINDAIINLATLGTRITSTSYSQGCNDYDTDAEDADNQIYYYPELIHVFSAGNSASDDCGYGASGWGNITGGTKQGKNVIASGNLDDEDNLASSSSRGPAEDGRIKPDLCANGAGQLSTAEGNIYDPGGGTSAASPSIAGTVAQLYDAYQEMNGGAFPNSGLIKASLLNTARDLDDHGPDFNTGWGRINASKAYRVLNEGRYKRDSVDQGNTKTHSISVPSGVEEVRVMVYWTDPAGSPSASYALVNDLNIQLTTPGGTSYDPWVLDHAPNQSSLDAPATRGRDSVNNVEQVTLSTPSAGNYTLDVEGYEVPQGPQRYWVVYEFLGSDVELTYPRGGEGFVPNTTEKIRWDAFGNAGSFDIFYTLDSGTTWSTVATNVSGSQRHYSWNVPNAISGDAFIRIERGSDADTNDTPFALMDTASNIRLDWVCPDSALLKWDTARGALGYKVYRLGNTYMDSIGVSSDTSFKIKPFDPGQEEWFSVSAIGPDSMEGRRAYAIRFSGNGTKACPLDTNLDLTMQSPHQGGVPSCNADSLPVKVRVDNVGLDSVLAFDLSYDVDKGTPFTMNYNDTLAPDSSVILLFPDSVEVSATPKKVRAWVDHPFDQSAYQDTSNEVDAYSFSSFLYTTDYGQDMEGLSICEGSHSDCEHSCSLSEGMKNRPHPSVDDIDWRVGEGQTPSSSTGPIEDFIPGSASGNYVYLEPSYGCEGKVGHLLTPCIEVNSATPILTYAYHMYGTDMGDLHVDIMVDGIWQKDVRAPIKGNQGSNWYPDTIDLSPYQGEQITVRFRGVTGDDFHSDIAIDGIQVIQDPNALQEAKKGTPSLSLYPNPTEGRFTLKGRLENGGAYRFSVEDMRGRSVRTYERDLAQGRFRTKFDLRSLEEGIYFLKTVTPEGKRQVTKFVIQR